MKQPTEKELITQFDEARKEYVREEEKLRDRYFRRFEDLLHQIAKLRKMKGE